ncbi:MAG: hypothetical protein U1E51_02860 [Candidatus Binatia bacterium]|nr:hypothetical protein [Candidatus Binatia bacterium]
MIDQMPRCSACGRAPCICRERDAREIEQAHAPTWDERQAELLRTLDRMADLDRRATDAAHELHDTLSTAMQAAVAIMMEPTP